MVLLPEITCLSSSAVLISTSPFLPATVESCCRLFSSKYEPLALCPIGGFKLIELSGSMLKKGFILGEEISLILSPKSDL